MKRDVLVALANKNFLPQAKQLFSSVYWNSGWKGDYLLLAYDMSDEDVTWFQRKGIIVKHCPQLSVSSEKLGDKITACKIYLFSDYFKRWENVLYLDVDILTRGSLDGLVDLDGFSACYSLGQTVEDNLIERKDLPEGVLRELSQLDLSRRAFNSGVMAFPTRVIFPGMMDELLETFNRYVKVGLFGGDQLPLNIYFYGKWKELPQAYNQITPLSNHEFEVKKLQGLVIHCVSFGDGPWDSTSIFHREWLENFEKADLIDLDNIPTIPALSSHEIARRSKSVVQLYLVGGSGGALALLGRGVKATKMLLSDPRKGYRKVKQLFG